MTKRCAAGCPPKQRSFASDLKYSAPEQMIDMEAINFMRASGCCTGILIFIEYMMD
jgi:hypothetical protein